MGLLRIILENKLSKGEQPTWHSFFQKELQASYFTELDEKVTHAYAAAICYPAKEDIFHAFDCPADTIRAIILGQDPYHEAGQAMGLSFSVRAGISAPPSLKNILREVESDIGTGAGQSTDLSLWQKQGVLLLNTVLTVENGKANAHAGFGWETFTDHAVQFATEENRKQVVGILWGASAQKKSGFFEKGCTIETVHPSPLSAYRGFVGSRPFSKANGILMRLHRETIDWTLPDAEKPMFRVIVASSRGIMDAELVESRLDMLLSEKQKTATVEIVSGCAAGPDTLGRQYAEKRHLICRCFPADWEHYGKAAGYIRNKQMAENAEALIAFWDGTSRETKNMIEWQRNTI